MPEAVARVVSELHPFTGDLRTDRVYTVVEIVKLFETESNLPETVWNRPHTALVQICGVKKDDEVIVDFAIALGSDVGYKIIKKVGV